MVNFYSDGNLLYQNIDSTPNISEKLYGLSGFFPDNYMVGSLLPVLYNLSSFRIEDDTSSRGSTCQDQNSTQNFESSENDNCNITNNEWEDQSENKEDVTPNKYCYHTSTSDTSNICILDKEAKYFLHSTFLSNINGNNMSCKNSLI